MERLSTMFTWCCFFLFLLEVQGQRRVNDVGNRRDAGSSCRSCPESCQSVERADGGCPGCICNGVLQADCPVLSSCSEPNCKVEHRNGCSACVCGPEMQQLFCPPLPPCPERCQQRLGPNNCPICDCRETVDIQCPNIECSRVGCRMALGDDGCPICVCDDPSIICPSIPGCPLGCIDMTLNGELQGCFFCNCTVAPKFFVHPAAAFPFGPPPSPFSNVFNRKRRPGNPLRFTSTQVTSDSVATELNPESNLPINLENQEMKQTGLQPACGETSCQPNCQLCIGQDGCGRCLCGHRATICPAVPSCPQPCLRESPRGCLLCRCSLPPFFPNHAIVPEFPPFLPGGPATGVMSTFVISDLIGNPHREIGSGVDFAVVSHRDAPFIPFNTGNRIPSDEIDHRRPSNNVNERMPVNVIIQRKPDVSVGQRRPVSAAGHRLSPNDVIRPPANANDVFESTVNSVRSPEPTENEAEILEELVP